MNGLALIIGNAKYVKPEFHLTNAVNDARDVSERLVTLGFTVYNKNDCTREEFERQLIQFGDDLKKFQIGLFFYAGHGFQIEGKNYLTAIDTGFYDRPSMKHSSVCLDEIIDRMQDAGPEIKILILDACRDNPLPEMRGVSREGLAPIYAPKGTIIAFSTSPGEKAKDSGAGRNSIYTGAFLKHIVDENIPIEEFFKRVRTSVHAHTKGKQTSWEHTSLIGDFYFNSGQLTHSSNLPYPKDYIADGALVSDGSDFAEMVVQMRSHNWYKQQPALAKFRGMDRSDLDDGQLFLIGRNILQMADGGERKSEKIMADLDQFLSKYNQREENHLLNGILFEIYFNSKGLFRQTGFKNKFINEIFSLQKNKKYKGSFDFIRSALRPFKDYIFYMPSHPPKSLAIDIEVTNTVEDWIGQEFKLWKITSIKHNNTELLHYQTTESDTCFKKDFPSKLAMALSAPVDQLTLMWSETLKDTATVGFPWILRLSRFSPEDPKEVD